MTVTYVVLVSSSTIFFFLLFFNILFISPSCAMFSSMAENITSNISAGAYAYIKHPSTLIKFGNLYLSQRLLATEEAFCSTDLPLGFNFKYC